MKGRKQQGQAQRVSLIFEVLKTTAAGYGGWWVWRHPGAWGWSQNSLDLLLLLLAVLIVQGLVMISGEFWRRLQRLVHFVNAVTGDGSKGTAGWLSPKEARRHGLHRRKRGARFSGILGNIPLWLWTETHHLVIGPAGSSKSSAVIFNILASIRHSCLISDIKGEIHEVMARFQERVLGMRIVTLNPLSRDSDRLNPVDLVAAYLGDGSAQALTLARGIALQLYPEPKEEGQNKFFRDGARRIIAGLILAAILHEPPGKATMAKVYLALTSDHVLLDVLNSAMKSNALKGEVAAIAEDIHKMAFGDDDHDYQQFRVGALNVLEVFGPGNHLHWITGATTFEFTELKRERIACYLMVDFNNIKVLGPWSGLMQYLAAFQLVETRNNVPVTFVLDEFCNAPLHILPEILTLLRTYGVTCVMATQDLADITRVYSKAALETILSESHIKQFLSGVRGKETLEYLSKYLGEITASVASYNLGKDGPVESRSKAERRLMTADEIRRLAGDLQIIIYGNLKPILARKVAIFAVAPWRHRIGINRLYGKKRFLLPVEVRIFWRWSWVTKRGRMRYGSAHFMRRIRLYIGAALFPSRAMAILAGLCLAIWMFGFPYLRWEYRYQGPRGNPAYYTQCDYIGPKPFTTYGRHCPVLLLKKDW